MKKLISVVLALTMIMGLVAGVVAFDAPAGINSLAIVGSGIPGVGEWNPADPAGDMELVSDYLYMKEVELTAGSSITFKVAGNDKWDDTCNFGTNGKQTLSTGDYVELTCGGGSGDMTFNADKDMTLIIAVYLGDFVEGGSAYIYLDEYVEPESIVLTEKTTVNLESAYDNVMYEVTPEVSGYLTFEISGNPGWRIMDYLDFDLFYDSDECLVTYLVRAGVTYQFALGCYDLFEDDYAPGDLTYAVTLYPADLGDIEDDEDAPLEQYVYMSCDDYCEITLPVGGVAYVEIDCSDYPAIFYVDGMYSFDSDDFDKDWYVNSGVQTGMPDDFGSYSVELPAGEIYTYTVVAGDEASGNQSITLTTVCAMEGTMNNPADLVMGENCGSFAEWQAFYFEWFPSESGILTLSANSDMSPDWSFYAVIESENGDVIYTDTLYSDDPFSDDTVSVMVLEGDRVLVCVMDPNFQAGTVYLDASFIPVEVEDPGDQPGGDVEIGDGDVVVNDVDVTVDEPWTYVFNIDGPGGLRVMIGNCTPGWRYKIEYPNGESSLYFTDSAWSVGPDYTHNLTMAGQYKVMIWAYDAANYDDVAGTISASVTFTPASGDVEIPKEEYVISDIMLGLGENELTLDETAITTIYEFWPEEAGIYQFVVGDDAALVGYWGAGSFYVFDQTENKTNVLEYKLDYVGPSIMVGVSGVEGAFTLSIEKIGDAEVIETIEYTEYTNKHIPQDKYLVNVTGEQIITPVDITKDQNVVKDAAGFYHLGNVNGPLLYVNLTTEDFDLIQAFYGGYGALTMHGKYTDGNGKDYYYDFLNAMRNYANILYNSDYDNGLYPLTEDLVMFLKAFGGYQGWYNPAFSSFDAIQADHNEDSAWLVTCCYIVTPSDFRVTGNADWLGNWAADNDSGMMMDLGNGSYQIIYSDVAAGEYELKVTKGGTWDENWGVGGANGENVKFTVNEGQSVIVTFNSVTGEIQVSLAGGEANPPSGDYSLAALVVAMMAATAGAVVLTKKKEF